MSTSESTENHPITLFENHPSGGFPKSEISLFLARSGVGKTAALINFALREMIEGKHVLHFSVGMNSEKVHQYYQELYTEYVDRFYDHKKPVAWNELTHHLTVISYASADNMAEQLSAELATLLENAHISPSLVLVDGLDADAHCEANLNHLQSAAQKHELCLVATLRIHRATDGHVDVETPFRDSKKFARRIFLMDPQKDQIRLEALIDSVDQPVLMPVHFSPHDLLITPN
ncbi:MAG: hypothetical protein KDC71_15050 [Acidobacteria bacterium]|nr:hypothetical protein [Acidobacteriota bacterium]